MAGIRVGSRNQLTVVGSAALDTIETPHGRVESTLGGSAFYIGAAGALFTPVHLVAVVGEDFPMDEIAFLKERGVNLDGLEVAPGKTFHWEGKYLEDMNQRETICTELGVFAGFKPRMTLAAMQNKYLLLANIDPELQQAVLDSVSKPDLVALDTMNLWIETKRGELNELLRRVDILTINDQELRLLSGSRSIMEGALATLKRGPSYIVVKRGEHGATLFGRNQTPFICSAYPLLMPTDPTGAGDSFAGAMMAYLAATGDVSPFNLRQAVVYGTVTASFTVEDFGLNRLRSLTADEVEQRLRAFRSMVEF